VYAFSVQTPVAIVLVLLSAKARKNKIQCKTNKIKKKNLNNYLIRTPARARNTAMMILNCILCTRTSGFKCLCNRSRSLRSRRSHYIVILYIMLFYALCLCAAIISFLILKIFYCCSTRVRRKSWRQI